MKPAAVGGPRRRVAVLFVGDRQVQHVPAAAAILFRQSRRQAARGGSPAKELTGKSSRFFPRGNIGIDLGGIETPYLLAEAMIGLVEDVSFAMIENHADAAPTGYSR